MEARASAHHIRISARKARLVADLIRGKSVEQAWQVLDNAREAMAERRLVNRANDMPFGKITFSGGVADVFAYAKPGDALKAADEALYAAKKAGRNRVVRYVTLPKEK